VVAPAATAVEAAVRITSAVVTTRPRSCSPRIWATRSRPARFPVCSACRSPQRLSSAWPRTRSSTSAIIPDVRGREVVVLDDEVARSSTIPKLLDHLADEYVASVRVACTHGLFTDGALRRIQARPEVNEIVCTDTVPIPDQSRVGKLTVLSVMPAPAEATRRIHNGEPVSVLIRRPVRPSSPECRAA